MLLSTGVIAQVQLVLQHIDKWNLIPFHNPYRLTSTPDYRFEVQPLYKTSHWKGHVLILLSVSIFGVFQLRFESPTFLDISLNVFKVATFPTYALFAYVHHVHCEAFANFLNQLISFEARFVGTAPENLWRSVKYTKTISTSIKVFIVAYQLLGLSLGLSDAFWPATTWKLVPLAVSKSYQSIPMIRMLLNFLYTYISTKKMANLAMLHVTINFLASFFSLHCFIIFMKQRFKNVQMYREVQLLCRLYNAVHQHHIIPGTLIIGIMLFTVCIYTLVSSWSQLDLKLLLIFSNALAIGTGVILFSFHLAARVNSESEQFLRSGLTHAEWKGGKRWGILKRQWRSLPVLRIYFFEHSFFERMTPLVILNFAITISINLILF